MTLTLWSQCAARADISSKNSCSGCYTSRPLSDPGSSTVSVSSVSRALPLLCCFFVLYACKGSDQAAAPPALPVSTLAIAERAAPMVLEAVGRTEGAKEVEIRARVSGIVEKRLYSEGAFVRAGETLFQIERAPFEIALAQARADAAHALATRDQALRESERVAGLLKNAAVSQRVAEEAETAYRSAVAAYDAELARVREAELNLSYTTVTAPIAGVTGRALHSEGSLVTANTDSSLLTTLSQTNPVWVRFALSETEHDELRRARDDEAIVEMVLADGKTYGARGQLNFAGSTVDRQLGTVQLRAEFPNPDLQILPGQFATVRVTAGTRQVIAVPQTAVLQGAQGRYVWTVDAQGKAAQRPVTTGAWLERDWIINSGLGVGDTVIVDNLMKLQPGAPVEPTPVVAEGTSSTSVAAN